jgi:flagellar basal-body rod protein FlgB
MNVLELAGQHRVWSARSQSLVAENIANANMPDYKAKTGETFESLAETRRLRPTLTHAVHIEPIVAAVSEPLDPDTAAGASHSGNTVDLDAELLRASEIRGGYALNTSLVKSLHRMLQSVVRS